MLDVSHDPIRNIAKIHIVNMNQDHHQLVEDEKFLFEWVYISQESDLLKVGWCDVVVMLSVNLIDNLNDLVLKILFDLVSFVVVEVV